MTTQQFAPKDAETLRAEIITELGVDYEGNKEMVDKMIARELKSEEFKASLHADKVKHLTRKEYYKKLLADAGFDTQTGKKITAEAKAEGGKENYSLSDIRALQDVHDDNVDRLVKYAKFLNISIAEAKKTPEMQIYLKDEKEKRKTAQAANTGESRRGVTQISDEQIVADAEAGKEVDPEKLAEARSNLRRAKKL